MVLLALPPADHLLIERDRGQFVPFSATPNDGQRPCRALAEDPGRTPAPSCVFPALQLKREWSPRPKFGADGANPRDLSKGIICDDISEFESHTPSHAVGSLWSR